jgi:hypothetical protein
MPNWCNNILTIQNPSTELVEYLKTEGFSFDKIKPMPPELKEGDGWYDWAVENWGTKWDLDENPLMADCFEEKEICFGFDTAWSPPMGVIETLSEKFPEDHFLLQYLEMGVGFGGKANFFDGLCIDNEFGDDNEEYAKFAEEVFGHEPYEDDE